LAQGSAFRSSADSASVCANRDRQSGRASRRGKGAGCHGGDSSASSSLGVVIQPAPVVSRWLRPPRGSRGRDRFKERSGLLRLGKVEMQQCLNKESSDEVLTNQGPAFWRERCLRRSLSGARSRQQQLGGPATLTADRLEAGDQPGPATPAIDAAPRDTPNRATAPESRRGKAPDGPNRCGVRRRPTILGGRVVSLGGNVLAGHRQRTAEVSQAQSGQRRIHNS